MAALAGEQVGEAVVEDQPVGDAGELVLGDGGPEVGGKPQQLQVRARLGRQVLEQLALLFAELDRLGSKAQTVPITCPSWVRSGNDA